LFPILILKTGALGDVVRTTALVPGLRSLHPDARITWVTAPGAVDLVRLHPGIAEVVALDARAEASCAAVRTRLAATRWSWLISLDDEEPLCALASALPSERLSGAYLDAQGRRAYTLDVGPWFDMGLLSIHGKAVADRKKIENRRSHPEILTSMLGLSMGKPELHVEPRHMEAARAFAERSALAEQDPVVGLNTGAGGRWRSKTLSVERTVELAERIHAARGGGVTFVLFGGADERDRNAEIVRSCAGRVRLVDAGVDNALLDFAARVGLCDVLITSDSLALHVGLARGVRIVSFFAPTSAAEIELYGQGEKVVSTAPDYCSYKPDADTSSLTPERIAEAALRQLALVPGGRAR
jgi:heptosyltransferase-2